MNQRRIWHDKAMVWAGKGLHQRISTPHRRYTYLSYRVAAMYEMKAAAGVEGEATRAVLYRSAAWLCIQGGWYQRAVDFAEAGMAETPPDMREELVEARDAALKQLDIVKIIKAPGYNKDDWGE